MTDYPVDGFQLRLRLFAKSLLVAQSAKVQNHKLRVMSSLPSRVLARIFLGAAFPQTVCDDHSITNGGPNQKIRLEILL